MSTHYGSVDDSDNDSESQPLHDFLTSHVRLPSPVIDEHRRSRPATRLCGGYCGTDDVEKIFLRIMLFVLMTALIAAIGVTLSVGVSFGKVQQLVGQSPLFLLNVPMTPIPRENRGIVYVGHRGPDTDTICSAIGLAKIFGGFPSTPEGVINKETEFVLSKFGLTAPLAFASFDPTKFDVCLVDNNDASSDPADPDIQQKIRCVFDHHPLGKRVVNSDRAIYLTIRPYGATCTIATFESIMHGVRLDKEVAGCMLAGILSDTLGLKSPHRTHNEDRAAAKFLGPLAGVKDIDAFARDMMLVKSDTTGLSLRQILTSDSKKMTVSNKLGVSVTITWATWETLAPQPLLTQATAIVAELAALKAQTNSTLIFFSIVDIDKVTSTLFAIDAMEQQLVPLAFPTATRVTATNNVEWILPNLVDRTFDFFPPLLKVVYNMT